MSFVYQRSENKEEFRCNLICKQCIGVDTKSGQQCKKKSCFALPYCQRHLASEVHVAIKPSTIKEAGLGLFALKNFARNERILEYIGLKWTQNQLFAIYGDTKFDFAPYAIKLGDNGYFVDAACMRSAASMANDARYPHKINAQLLASLDEQHIWLVPQKPIQAGEEIFVSYGPKYWADQKRKGRSTFQTLRTRTNNPTPFDSLGDVMKTHTNAKLMEEPERDDSGLLLKDDVSTTDDEGEDC